LFKRGLKKRRGYIVAGGEVFAKKATKKTGGETGD